MTGFMFVLCLLDKLLKSICSIHGQAITLIRLFQIFIWSFDLRLWYDAIDSLLSLQQFSLLLFGNFTDESKLRFLRLILLRRLQKPAFCWLDLFKVLGVSILHWVIRMSGVRSLLDIVLRSHVISRSLWKNIVIAFVLLFELTSIVKISQICFNLHLKLKILAIIETLQFFCISDSVSFTFKITGHVQHTVIDGSKTHVWYIWFTWGPYLGFLCHIEAICFQFEEIVTT